MSLWLWTLESGVVWSSNNLFAGVRGDHHYFTSIPRFENDRSIFAVHYVKGR